MATKDTAAIMKQADDYRKQQQQFSLFSYANIYGPYAFGVASLLLIWFTIVKPELSARNVNYEAHLKVISELKELNNANQETARTIETTAESLQITATILERTVQLLDKQ